MDFAEFRWNRILSFCIGILTTYYYFSLDIQFSPLYASFSSVPIGFILYGVTSQSWRTIVMIIIATGVGMGLGTYLDGVGYF